MAKETTIAVIIVAYGNTDDVVKLVEILEPQKKTNDKIIVVDNHPSHSTAKKLKEKSLIDVIKADANNGFGAGCNLGVNQLDESIDVLVFINPDTTVEDNFIDSVRGQVKKNNYRAWMPLLVTQEGTTNSAGNIVHISGLSWVGGLDAPVSQYSSNMKINAISGACMIIDKDLWHELGGITEEYFMYYEDTDISTRINLLGEDMYLVPSIKVTHDYDYEKGTHKWVYIERNRLLYIIRTWPFGVIVILLPVLAASGVSLWLVALMQGRFMLKIRSSFMLLKSLPWALKTRKKVLSSSRISTVEFLQKLEYEMDNKNLGPVSRLKFVAVIFKSYYTFSWKILSLVSKKT